MSIPTSHISVPSLYHELVNDRIQTLHQEAREQRLVARISRIQRAQRRVQRANERLSRALSMEG